MANDTAGRQVPAPRPIGAVVFILLCAALGLGFLNWSLSQLWYLHASKGWPATEGSITRSEYVDHGPRRGGDAEISYLYSVDGQFYTGGNLLPGSSSYVDRDEEQKVRQYRPGMRVPVFYDPANPQSSALEVGVITRLPFLGLALGLFFLGGAGYIVWGLLRRRPARL